MSPKRPQGAAKAVAKKQKQKQKQKEEDTDSKPAKSNSEGNQGHVQNTSDAPASEDKDGAQASTKKRKASSSSSQTSKKARENGTKASSRRNPPPTPDQLLHFLLSDEALPFCYPDDETDASESKTYSGTSPASFSPFEHLLIASLLSKPLSHKLGMRSIRTLLNPPFSLNSASAIADAGEKRVWEALETARTQHRQKTAAYISGMAERFVDDGNLSAVREGDVMREIRAIKGMGGIGAGIFARRVQCLPGWEKVYPFADRKALDALVEMGVGVGSAEELADLLKKVDIKEVKVGDGLDEEQKRSVAFVLVLERAVGAGLEGRAVDVKKESAAL